MAALDDRAAAKRTIAATLSKTYDRTERHNKYASELALCREERSGANAWMIQAFALSNENSGAEPRERFDVSRTGRDSSRASRESITVIQKV